MAIEQLENNTNAAALSWLIEMELVNNPNVLNAMILNVFRMVRGIKDAEFVIDVNNKKLLIYLELNWWNRKFNQKAIEQNVHELFDQVLPAFKRRVVFERAIIEKALQLISGKENGDLK